MRITTRQALNRIRTLQRRKEAYVGPWLPEPLLTAPDVAEHVELSENLSLALMFILETLSPTERAVFVLREVFEFGYDEIAEAIDKTPAAARQIAHRAREHVDARRPRKPASQADARAALDSFQHALATGNLQGLLDVLAPDVVFVSDGGGIEDAAALRPVVGAEKVLRFLVGIMEKLGGVLTGDFSTVNGNPALLLRVDGELDGVLALRVEDGPATRPFSTRKASTPSISPSRRRRSAGLPLTVVGSPMRAPTPPTLSTMPIRKRSTFSAPTTGRWAAILRPPPSLTKTTSGASTSSSPCRSPVTSARWNESNAARASFGEAGVRGRRASTCLRARCAIWRAASGLLSIAAAISS